MTKIKKPIDNGLSVSEGKFLKEIREYFGVDAKEIKAVLKELNDANGDTNKLVLTEQFNLGVIAGMKQMGEGLETYLSANAKQPIQDFKEIDPTANVENITIEDIIITKDSGSDLIDNALKGLKE